MTAPYPLSYSPLYLPGTGIIPSPSRTSTTSAMPSPSRIPPIIPRSESSSRLSRTSPQPLYSPRTSPSHFPPSPPITSSPPRTLPLPIQSRTSPSSYQLTIQVLHHNLSDKDIKKFLKIILRNLLGFGKFALMKIHDDLYRVYFDDSTDAAMVFDALEENDNGFGLELHVRY